MMGGDPSLSKFLSKSARRPFWTRGTGDLAESIQVIHADSAEAIKNKFSLLEIFEPSADLLSMHQKIKFHEYDIDEDPDDMLRRFI